MSSREPEADQPASTGVPEVDGSAGESGGAPISPLYPCFQLLGRVEDQIRFADAKAGFLGTLHSFLISPLIYNVGEFRAAYRGWDSASLKLLVGFSGAYGILFLVAMGLVGLTVVPRTRKQGRSPSRLFFGQIAREFGGAPEEFIRLVNSMSERTWIDQIGVYLVDVSEIATVKHRYARRATLVTIPAVILWTITVLLFFLIPSR